MTVDVVSPITGEPIAELTPADVADVDGVMDRAVTCRADWSDRPAAERGRLLRRVAALLREDREQLADLETRNTGKPLFDTRREVERAAACFEYYAGYADKVLGTTVPVPGDYHTYTLRGPHGVAVGIIPWNAPLVFAAKKVAPALAFGNVSVLKPALETPLTALRLRALMDRAGLASGAAQVVVGGGDVGAALVADPRADLIVFTGHHTTGRAIAEAAAGQLTPTTLELGGKSPQIVFADADLDAAIAGVTLGFVGACGQMCIAGSRLYVQREILQPVLDRLAAGVTGLRVGDPRDAATQVGPQTTAVQRDKTLRMMADAADRGARVLAQAEVPDRADLAGGYWVPPTVFVDVDPTQDILREEVFGPVLAVAPFASEDEAVALANDSVFGLAAGVWTSDLGRAHRVARELEAGTVWLNTYRVLSDLVPFGGIGTSGYGRENGEAAVETYTRTKAVWTAFEPGLPGGYRL